MNVPAPLTQLIHQTLNRVSSTPLSRAFVTRSIFPLLVTYGQRIDEEARSYMYKLRDRPGIIHHAIARLSQPINVHGTRRPGLASIVTCAIDDDIGTAIDDLGLPRCTSNEFAGVRTEVRSMKKSLRDHQNRSNEIKIFSTNLFIPREKQNNDLDTVVFRVLSKLGTVVSSSDFPTSEDEAEASRALASLQPSPEFILEANEAATGKRESHVLIVGMALDDQATEELMSHWHGPGPCQYYALLMWPSHVFQCRYADADAVQIRNASLPFWTRLVQPVWFDSSDEIPVLLEALADE